MAVDEIALKILVELENLPLTADVLATKCAGGASRMIAPRLVWLEGLGLVDNLGLNAFAITDAGRQVRRILSSQPRTNAPENHFEFRD